MLSAILALFLTLPPEVEAAVTQAPERRGFGAAAFAAGSSLLGHPPAMPTQLAGESDIDLILFDLGGTIYDDDCFAQALLRAIHELNPSVSENEFWQVYDSQRGQLGGSLRTALATRFVPGADRKRLSDLAQKYLEYPSSALYPDVRPTLTALASKYKLGLVANSSENVLEDLRRDGLDNLFSVVALPSMAGAGKPDLRIFRYALEKAGVPASAAVCVGNRLDNDLRRAQQLGMRTVWLLRGEVPPAPTMEQLEEPDADITSLLGLPTALSRLARVSTGVAL